MHQSREEHWKHHLGQVFQAVKKIVVRRLRHACMLAFILQAIACVTTDLISNAQVRGELE
jgi:hypothetical protein